MQELRKIGEDETLANSLDPMNKNWKSLQSQNSGVTFPIKDIVVGQACFREDELALYMCANVEKNLWIKVADLTLTYVDKEYVDSMHIDLNRIDNIIDPSTGKIKMSLMNVGVVNGQLVGVGANNKIATSLIDTGINAGQIVMVNDNKKIATSLLPIGLNVEQIPMLVAGGKLPDSTIPTNVAKFNSSGQLVFPNGAVIWVG